MNLSMHFQGMSEEIITEALKRGVVKTKAEAIRLGLLELNDKYGLIPRNSDEVELMEDQREIDRIERDLKTGKEKLHRVKDINSISK